MDVTVEVVVVGVGWAWGVRFFFCSIVIPLRLRKLHGGDLPRTVRFGGRVKLAVPERVGWPADGPTERLAERETGSGFVTPAASSSAGGDLGLMPSEERGA